jgi:hypothetical protein
MKQIKSNIQNVYNYEWTRGSTIYILEKTSIEDGKVIDQFVLNMALYSYSCLNKKNKGFS